MRHKGFRLDSLTTEADAAQSTDERSTRERTEHVTRDHPSVPTPIRPIGRFPSPTVSDVRCESKAFAQDGHKQTTTSRRYRKAVTSWDRCSQHAGRATHRRETGRNESGEALVHEKFTVLG